MLRTPALTQVIEAALDNAQGLVQQAADEVYDKVTNNDVLYRQLMDPLVKQACYDAVRGYQHNERSAIFAASPQPQTRSPEEQRAAVEALAEGTRKSLLNLPLPSGKRLGDATKAEVLEAARFYTNQGTSMLQRALFFNKIADKLNRNQIVRNVLDESELDTMYGRVKTKTFI